MYWQRINNKRCWKASTGFYLAEKSIFLSNIFEFHSSSKISLVLLVTEYFKQGIFCESSHFRNVSVSQTTVSITWSDWNLIKETQWGIFNLVFILFLIVFILIGFSFDCVFQWGREVQDCGSEVGYGSFN